jgi:hypothetical protein
MMPAQERAREDGGYIINLKLRVALLSGPQDRALEHHMPLQLHNAWQK